MSSSGAPRTLSRVEEDGEDNRPLLIPAEQREEGDNNQNKGDSCQQSDAPLDSPSTVVIQSSWPDAPLSVDASDVIEWTASAPSRCYHDFPRRHLVTVRRSSTSTCFTCSSCFLVFVAVVMLLLLVPAALVCLSWLSASESAHSAFGSAPKRVAVVDSASAYNSDDVPRIWSLHGSVHPSMYWAVLQNRFVLLEENHPLRGPDTHWNAAAERHFQSFLHRHQYTVEYARLQGHDEAAVQRECAARQYVMWVQWPYGMFSRTSIYTHALMLHLRTNAVFVLTDQGSVSQERRAADRGLFDFFLPTSACHQYALSTDRGKYVNIGELVPSLNEAGYHDDPFAGWGELLRNHSATQFISIEPTNEQTFSVIWSRAVYNHVSALPVRAELFGAEQSSGGVEADQLWTQFVVHQIELFLCRPSLRIKLLAAAIMANVSVSVDGESVSPMPLQPMSVDDIHNVSSSASDSLSPVVGLQIRRGDKAREDPYYTWWRYWRPIATFVQQVVDWIVTYSGSRAAEQPLTHYILLTDDAELFGKVQRWAGGQDLSVMDQSPQHVRNDSFWNLFWLHKQALQCNVSEPGQQYLAALADDVRVNHGEQPTFDGKVLTAYDCFLAQVLLLSSDNTRLAVVSEGSNIADHIIRYRCALKRHTPCDEAMYAEIDPLRDLHHPRPPSTEERQVVLST